MKRVVFFLALFLLSTPAWALTKYGRAVGGNWSADATWSTTSGGGADTTRCVAADACILDSASGNVTVDADSAAGSINCTGYTGTLTLGANLTVSGSLTFSSGMTFTPSTYIVTIDNTSSITSAGKSFGKLTFNGASKTYTLTDAMVCSGLVTFNLYAGIINGYTLTLEGGLTQNETSSTSQYTGTTKLIFGGSGTQTWTGGNASVDMDIDINTSGTLNLSGNIKYGNATNYKTLRYVSGTVKAGTSVLWIRQRCTLDLDGVNFYDVKVNRDGLGTTATVTLSSDLTYTHALTWTDISITMNGNNLNAQGDITGTTGAAWVWDGTTVLNINGGNNQVFTSDTSTLWKPSITINKSGNTIRFASQINYGIGTFTITAGTVNFITNTVLFKNIANSNINMGAAVLYDFQVSTAGNATLTGNLNISHTTTVDSGRTLALGSNTLTVQGGVVVNGTLNTGTGKVALDGATATQAFSGSNGVTFYDFEYISAEEKTITFQSGETYIFSNSLLIIEPYGGAAVTINASTPDTVALWNISGATQQMERATVADIDASAGDIGHMYKGDVTDAQNVNWDAACSVTPTAVTTACVWAG